MGGIPDLSQMFQARDGSFRYSVNNLPSTVVVPVLEQDLLTVRRISIQ